MGTITKHLSKFKRNKRGVSNVIVIVLSLVILVIIASNIILWSYQMNQVDWEKMQENLKIVNVTPINSSSWFAVDNEYTASEGNLVSGNYTATISVDDSYETFMEGTVPQTLYLQRTDVSGLTPTGKLMDTIQPLLNQSEIESTIGRGSSAYFYTSALSTGSIQGGTWTLYIWVSTVSSGKVSRLTVRIHLVSSDGTVEKATIGAVTDIIVDYGYSERVIALTCSATNITAGDRVRLTLYAQAGAQNDSKGMSFYYDGYGAYETADHETRLQSPSPGGYRLRFNGTFLMDLSTYPLAYVKALEIQLRYRTDDAGEKWYLKAYNGTSTTYNDNGFNSTTGHVPTIGWDYYAVNITGNLQSYIKADGSIRIMLHDENTDSTQAIVDVDFLAVRIIIEGIQFSFDNQGALTCHIVSIWIINSTTHVRYEANIYINAGEALSYIRTDISLPNSTYYIKVTTERGNIAVYSS